MLYVDDVARAVEFAERAFGLTRRFVTPEGDYAEMETGATALAFCDRSLGEDTTGLELIGTGPSASVTLIVDDVDGAYERAIHAGAAPILAPTTKPWGQTSSFVRDLDGHLIELATAIQT